MTTPDRQGANPLATHSPLGRSASNSGDEQQEPDEYEPPGSDDEFVDRALLYDDPDIPRGGRLGPNDVCSLRLVPLRNDVAVVKLAACARVFRTVSWARYSEARVNSERTMLTRAARSNCWQPVGPSREYA